MGKLIKTSNLNRAASMVPQHLELYIHVPWPSLIRAAILLFSAAQRFMTSMPRKFFSWFLRHEEGKLRGPLSKYDIIPIICHQHQRQQRYRRQNLPPVSSIPLVHLDLRISPRIFEKIWKDPNVIFRGLGEDDSWKKPEAKYLVTLSL